MKTKKAWVRGEGVVIKVDRETGDGLIACGPLSGNLQVWAKDVRDGTRLAIDDKVDFDIAFAGATARALDVRVVAPGRAGKKLIATSFDAATQALRAASSPSQPRQQPQPQPQLAPSFRPSAFSPARIAALAADIPGERLGARSSDSSLPDERTHPMPPGRRVTFPPAKPRTTGRPRPDISESRDRCGHCKKLMVPRLVVHKGAPSHSLCPFCGGVHKDFSKVERSGDPTLLAAGLLLLGGLLSG